MAKVLRDGNLIQYAKQKSRERKQTRRKVSARRWWKRILGGVCVRSDNWNPCGRLFGKAKREYQGRWDDLEQEAAELKLYNQELERLKHLKVLLIWFDEKLTLGSENSDMVYKSKRLVNIMRCLVGREWGANRRALKSMYSYSRLWCHRILIGSRHFS